MPLLSFVIWQALRQLHNKEKKIITQYIHLKLHDLVKDKSKETRTIQEEKWFPHFLGINMSLGTNACLLTKGEKVLHFNVI